MIGITVEIREVSQNLVIEAVLENEKVHSQSKSNDLKGKCQFHLK